MLKTGCISLSKINMSRPFFLLLKHVPVSLSCRCFGVFCSFNCSFKITKWEVLVRWIFDTPGRLSRAIFLHATLSDENDRSLNLGRLAKKYRFRPRTLRELLCAQQWKWIQKPRPCFQILRPSSIFLVEMLRHFECTRASSSSPTYRRAIYIPVAIESPTDL